MEEFGLTQGRKSLGRHNWTREVAVPWEEGVWVATTGTREVAMTRGEGVCLGCQNWRREVAVTRGEGVWTPQPHNWDAGGSLGPGRKGGKTLKSLFLLKKVTGYLVSRN